MNYPVSFVFLLFSLFSAASFPVFVIFCFSAFSDEAARPLLGPGHPPVHSAYWFLYGLPGKMLRGFLPASHPGRPPILRILVPVHSKPYFPASSPADPSVLLPAGPPVDFPAYFLLSIPVYHPDVYKRQPVMNPDPRKIKRNTIIGRSADALPFFSF